jgi:transcription elongation factor GreA
MNNKPAYLSKEGLDKLREELNEMVTVRRAEVAARIQEAKEHGDITENAEYEDAKNEQAMVEGRILQLQSLLQNATIIDQDSAHKSKSVILGSNVKMKTADGKAVEYTIVGPAEADPRDGKISNESPVGRALLGKKLNDEVQVNAPKGIITYKITKIS